MCSCKRNKMMRPNYTAGSRAFADGLGMSLHNAQQLDLINNSIRAGGITSQAERFIQQVTSFLERDDIPHRRLASKEVHRILNSHAQQLNAIDASSRIDKCKIMMSNRTVLLVGRDCKSGLENGISKLQHSYVLHLCPTLHLDQIQDMYQQCHGQHGKEIATILSSDAVASYAWLNACLSNAFLHYNPGAIQTLAEHNNESNPIFEPVSVVHLHQDVWNRSPTIVQSRLRSKCGMHSNNGRIFARKTASRRIPKSEYLPFLEENHLWGATSAKYAYGLYLKVNNKQQDVDGKAQPSDESEEILVAVATFSSKRKVFRASHIHNSYELLRFCTKLDTTIVGGLTKLVSAFVKDVCVKNQASDSVSSTVGIDIITSVDRDFGSNKWPGFDVMDVMDPIPMFVGESDGIRRHAVGAGLIPLDQSDEQACNSTTLSASEILRAGLPDKLRRELHHQHNDASSDDPFGFVAQNGFHPVFDAGVERLMRIISNPNTVQSTDTQTGSENVGWADVTPSQLWEQSVPRFVNEHYSSNAGVEKMLMCIQRSRLKRHNQVK
jgi:hypothetical protein